MLDGLMMEWPLTLTPLLERACRIYAGQQIATRTAGGVRRTSFAESVDRIERLASALSRLGVRPGERVATMAWNSQGHFEAYLGVPSMGAVLHTVNFRLFHDQMVHVMNHAEDRVVLVDASVYPVLEKVRPRLKTVREVVVLDDVGQGVPPGTLDFEELVRGGEPGFQWPALEERAAAVMCYTSGTTGHPKGCVYTHRALVLHTLGMNCSGLGLSDADTALVIVPMFHANAWGMPFAALMFGVNQVFPGRFMQPADLAALIESERATYVAGVPTIVAGILMALRQQPRDVSSIRLVTVGGSALPESLLDGWEKGFGVNVVQGWGMTEMSPVGSMAVLKGRLKDSPVEEQRRVRLSQGLPLPCVEIRIVDDAGRAL
ncbi:MAG TPA: AMP-binding protein, partial [Gemmatimonadales bacterium]